MNHYQIKEFYIWHVGTLGVQYVEPVVSHFSHSVIATFQGIPSQESLKHSGLEEGQGKNSSF
jgi:hypothetical protein